MNITILTIGTRGDVQPYVALGVGLQAVGYTVTLATAIPFETLVRAYGLNYAPLHGEFLQLIETPEGRAALEGGGNYVKLLRKVMPMLRRMLDDGWTATQGADAIVYHPKALSGYHIAEKLGVPAFLSLPVPAYSPTHAFPNPVLPVRRNLGGFFNRLSYSLLLRAITAPYHRLINRWRRQALGLPPRSIFQNELQLHGRPLTRLYCCSPHVVPRPADWDVSSIMTGYWFLDYQPGWQPPSALVEFLEAGPPPVYIGFGSMAGRKPERVTSAVLQALARMGQRAVLATGWGGLTPASAPPNVCVVDAVPHDWLFPKVAAVVHHGGAGTTAAGLRAGKPTLVCPFFGDQPFWGERVHALGVGPQPIPQKKLTAERLAFAMQSMLTDTTMQERAARLGEQIRAEQGVTRAVEVIRQQVGTTIDGGR